MPTVQVPLQSWNEITELKRDRDFAKLAAKKVALKQQEELVKQELEQVNQELYLVMDRRLPSESKSVEFEGYMLTAVEAGESSRFDRQKLLKRPIQCGGCAMCRAKKVRVFVTVKDIEACSSTSDRKPTVRAEKIKTAEEKKRSKK